MTFQNPHVLYALIAIAIPILVHLFNFRKHKHIYFSSIRFLKEIKKESRKTSELKNILILFSRIFAMSFLILSFAKPFIPTGLPHVNNNIILYIDNSQSMDIDFGQGNLLNNAKIKAIEIINAYPKESNFYLITNDFDPQNISSYTAELIKFQIEKIKASPRQRSLKDIISRSNNINNTNNHLYFISDFQKNSLKINTLKEKKINHFISLVPISNFTTNNISIDSLYTIGPILKSDNQLNIHVIISNPGEKSIQDEVLYLYLDNKQKSQQYINLLPKETKEIIFNITLPNYSKFVGELRTYDSPITFDNNLFFTLSRSKKVKVFIINKENENNALNAIYGQDTTLFNLTSVKSENINYNRLLRQDFVILNEIEELSSGLKSSLVSFLNNGKSLLLVPPKDLNKFKKYNTLLKSLDLNTIINKNENLLKINEFSTKHPLYRNVFKSSLTKINYPISSQNYLLDNKILSTKIIGLADKQSFLVSYNSNKGNIYQFSSPLNINYNNFTKHALFVPTLINIAIFSVISNKPYYLINANNIINSNYISSSTNIIRIKGENNEIIPTIINKNGMHLLNHHHQITENGIYSIINDGYILDKIAFNYNSAESKMLSFDKEELKNYISANKIQNIKIISSKNSGITKIIKEQINGKEYWKIALIISLFFFACEILLIKFIKI